LKAIFGLGNPGPRYKGTRHNIGFEVLDELARRADVGFESAPAEALIARIRGNVVGAGAVVGAGFSRTDHSDDVLLAKPLTFMNASGQAIGELVRYFKIDVADMLVVVDEIHLPLGKLRARMRGSAGGHNGLKSVIAHLGTDFARLRIGVGRGDARRDLADYVTSRFDKDEAADVERMTTRAADAAQMFVTDGIAAVMNQFNSGDPATTE
jgi:peptidyl-tRNA hydrolase, PTH1 family